VALVDIRGRNRTRDQHMIAVRTAPGGADRHQHCARMDEKGNGVTSPGPGGHTHRVRLCDILPAPDGHRHDLSAVRCRRYHDERGRHVE
jgi:hypothetical protein